MENHKRESQFGTQSWLTGKSRSFQVCMGNSCACLHKMSLVNSLKFFWGRLRVCLYVQMITRVAFTAWAKGLEKHKNLKCKMVCYLLQERSVGTRCYLYVGNGLSHLQAQITDLLSFSPSLRHYWSFSLSCPHTVTSMTQLLLLSRMHSHKAA